MRAHCQGCGTAAGQPILTWHNRKVGDQQWKRCSRNHGLAILTEVDLVGWPRTLCQRCRQEAIKLQGDLEMFGVVRPDGPKKKPAVRHDPRQLTF